MRNFFSRIGEYLDVYNRGTLKLLMDASAYSHGMLLDVGCGKKPFLSLFEKFVNSYIGVEKLNTFQLTADSNLTVPDCYFDGYNLPFADESFDTVVSFSVLEHTPDPALLFKEMARVLKKTGVMIQYVPFSYRLHEEPYDFYRFTPYALKNFCQKNNLRVQKITANGNFYNTMCHKIITYTLFNILGFSKLAQSLGKMGMEKKSSELPKYWLIPLAVPLAGLALAIIWGLGKLSLKDNEPLAYLLIACKSGN